MTYVIKRKVQGSLGVNADNHETGSLIQLIQSTIPPEALDLIIPRTLKANDANPVLTLDQNGAGYNLLLEANAPELRIEEVDRTDPEGRYRIAQTVGDFVIERKKTSGAWPSIYSAAQLYYVDISSKRVILIGAAEDSDEGSLELYGASNPPQNRVESSLITGSWKLGIVPRLIIQRHGFPR